MASSRILWSIHIQWHIYNDILILHFLSNLWPVALAGTGRYSNPVWPWSGSSNVSDKAEMQRVIWVYCPLQNSESIHWVNRLQNMQFRAMDFTLRKPRPNHMDITLRNMQCIKRDSSLPHDIEESASIVVGNVPELSEVFLQFPSSSESPAARLDHLLCTYCFDLIPYPRDVFVGLSLFVR